MVSKSTELIKETKSALAAKFTIRDLGPTSFLLGVHITRDRANRSLSLSQRQYCIDLLARFNMSDCKPLATPMTAGLRLTKDMCPSTPDEIAYMQKVPYLNAVGALNFLATATRPDIAFTVSKLARFNSNPGIPHWTAVKHLFRYIQGTKDLRITYAPDPSSTSLFTTWTDADYAREPHTGKSTNGYVVKIGTGAVCWASKLQGVVARSSTEAEFYGASFAGTEIKWLRELLKECGYTFDSPSPVFVDNTSTIQVLNDSVQKSNMRHITVQEYWIRDEIAKFHTISVHYCPSEEMPADLLTKPLSGPLVVKLRELMGLS